jgi:hypothetical protein
MGSLIACPRSRHSPKSDVWSWNKRFKACCWVCPKKADKPHALKYLNNRQKRVTILDGGDYLLFAIGMSDSRPGGRGSCPTSDKSHALKYLNNRQKRVTIPDGSDYRLAAFLARPETRRLHWNMRFEVGRPWRLPKMAAKPHA